MNKKAYLQISFAWLFAIIVGAFILFLAIYFSIKLINTETTIQDAKTGKEIGVLLNPLETGFESGTSSSISFPIETRIYNKCNTNGEFGRQIIQVSQKSFNKWGETNIDVGFSNKYIFSDDYVEGKKFYIFSKQFEFPFKVSDLMLITSSLKRYCFKDAPEEIAEEISFLNQGNLVVGNCSDIDIKVCFSVNCDIRVNLNTNQVIKNGDSVLFQGDALMYAAIFSEKDIYECQVKRLMQRVDNLALLYNDKAGIVSKKECDSNLNLLSLSNAANSLESSSDLRIVNSVADDIQDENELGGCRLW